MHWIKNFAILNDDSERNEDMEISTIQNFFLKFKKSLGNLLMNFFVKMLLNESSTKNCILFTCKSKELSAIPKKLVNLIYFEFIIKDLTPKDRLNFAELKLKNVDIRIREFFVENTKVIIDF